MKSETPRQVAERVAWSVIGNHVEPMLRGQLIDAIEAAFNDRDERAAKIAETHERTHGNMHFGYCGPAIATAIRSTDEN